LVLDRNARVKPSAYTIPAVMIGFGIFLLIVAALKPQYHMLGRIGGLCIIIGLILAVLGTIGHGVGGRRHYY
jgi:1,4-dihydroxy-2-naphthoate octaprenyltransferase